MSTPTQLGGLSVSTDPRYTTVNGSGPGGFNPLGGLIGGTAEALGALTGSKDLTNLGHNITNPNVTLTNPGGLLQSHNPAFTGQGAYGSSPLGSSAGTPSPTPSSPNGTGGNVLGSATSGGNGSSFNSGAGTGNPQYSGFQNYLGLLSNAYNSLFGANGLDEQQANDQITRDNQYYGSQKNALNSQYAQNMQTLPQMYMARGIGDSSYAHDALGYAKNTFNSNMNDINYNQNNDISAIQKALEGDKAQGNAQLKQYQDLVNNGTLADMPNYLQAEQLGNIMNSYTAAQQRLGSTGANSQFLSHIPAPVQNQGTADLQSQLAALAKSPTTGAAQNQIAQALIGSSSLTPQQQAAGQAYWQQVSNAT